MGHHSSLLINLSIDESLQSASYSLYTSEDRPDPVHIPEGNGFFQPITEYEKFLFEYTFESVSNWQSIRSAIEATRQAFESLELLKDYRQSYLPDSFKEPDGNQFFGADVVPEGFNDRILIPDHYTEYPVHFNDAGYLNHKNVRLAFIANRYFYFEDEEISKRWIRNIIYNELGFNNPDKILDIGCGTGIATFSFADIYQDASEVVGIDLSPPFIRFCRDWKEYRLDTECSSCRNISFYQQNGENLHWSDEYFDIIHVTYVLHEMPAINAKKILSEMYRLLKPGGCLSIMDVSYSKNSEDREMRISRGTLGDVAGNIVRIATRLLGYDSSGKGFKGPEPFLDEYMNEFRLPEAIHEAGFINLQRHFDSKRYFDHEDDGYFVTAQKPTGERRLPLCHHQETQ